MSDNKKPVSRLTLFPISCAIWKNETGKGEFYNVTFERSYKDGDGAYQSSSSFGRYDLLLLARLADDALSEIYKLRARDRQEHRIAE